MSQFLTIAGPSVVPDLPSPLRAVRAKEAQYYVEALVGYLEENDGTPIYLIEDGFSGTSEEVFLGVSEVVQTMTLNELARSTFGKMIAKLVELGFVVRLWDAGLNPSAQGVNTVSTLPEFLELVRSQGAGSANARLVLTSDCDPQSID